MFCPLSSSRLGIVHNLCLCLLCFALDLCELHLPSHPGAPTPKKMTHTVHGRNPFRTTLQLWEAAVCWMLQGNRILPGFLRWCERDFVHPQYVPFNITRQGVSTYGWGSKNRYQHDTLASGNMDQTLRNPSSLIWSHSHMLCQRGPRAIRLLRLLVIFSLLARHHGFLGMSKERNSRWTKCFTCF